jgi:hypothetical protein
MPSNNNTIDKSNKANEAALATKLVAGTQKHLSTLAQVIVAGGTYTPAQAVTQLQAFIALRADVEAALAVYKAKLQNEDTQGPALRTFFIAFVTYVRSAFGSSPDVLADFGLAPKKVPAPRTAEQKAATAAKAKATRAARGTKGPKAKLSVKGNVTGVTVIPITTSGAPEPAQPAPAPAPATSPAQAEPTPPKS